jgi:predicted phosphodiesterase
MRLGLIGDVHAEDERLSATIDAFHEERVDVVLCTGDLVDGRGDIDRTCAILRSEKIRTHVIRGNHDRWIREDTLRDLPHAHRMTDLAVETVTFLKSLPPTIVLEIPGGKLLLCHGVGDNDMQRLVPDDHGYAIASNDALMKVLFDPTIRVMVAGHTHVPMVRRFERAPGKPPLVVVNPGTLARDDKPGFAILDAVTKRVDFYRIKEDLGVEAVSHAVL